MSLKYQTRIQTKYGHRIKWVSRHGKGHSKNSSTYSHQEGYLYWCEYGKYHREDGIAVYRITGEKSWWIHGKQYTQEEYESKIRSLL